MIPPKISQVSGKLDNLYKPNDKTGEINPTMPTINPTKVLSITRKFKSSYLLSPNLKRKYVLKTLKSMEN